MQYHSALFHKYTSVTAQCIFRTIEKAISKVIGFYTSMDMDTAVKRSTE